MYMNMYMYNRTDIEPMIRFVNKQVERQEGNMVGRG